MPAIPRGDALALTRALVATDSRNPSLAPGAPGERAVADLLAATLREWGFAVEIADAAPGLLNVADPSSRRVLDERSGSEGTTVTAGFRIGVVALGRGGRVDGTLPALDADGRWPLDRLTLWTWPTWDTPTWHEYLKPAYTALQQLWRAP